MVGFKHSGSSVGVNSTGALKAIYVSSHFAGSGSLCNFYDLLKHLKMTTAGTKDEKGS